MNAAFLFDYPEYVEPIKWNEKAVSASHDERQIIRWIMLLHNGGRPFDADITYSTGHIWEGLPKPRLKLDLNPQAVGVIAADARTLPLATESLQSIMFDPPFIISGPRRAEQAGIMGGRFSRLSYRDAVSLYQGALAETWRILRPSGLLVFKCQDSINNSTPFWAHVEIMNWASAIGFECEDLLVLLRNQIIWAPNMEHQQHARKNHSYYLVFKK